MKLPKRIQVGSGWYQVREDKSLVGNNHRGETDYVQRELRISPTCSPEQKAVTLLHEILHVIEVVYLCEDLEERQIKAMAEGLAQALQSAGLYPARLDD